MGNPGNSATTADRVISSMRLFSRIEDKRSVDEPDYVRPRSTRTGACRGAEEHYTVNPVASASRYSAGCC